MVHTTRHKVFISFHHEDQYYKNQFAIMMDGHIVDKSVEDGDIDVTLNTDTIRQKIRDEFIRDATVTVVLIGACTWQRKHVDWEIGSSLRDTRLNKRCGLLGIILPTHPNYGRAYNPRLIPPRVADNLYEPDPFAFIIYWTQNAQGTRDWIHNAFLRRNQDPPPINSRLQYGYNRPGDCGEGWKD